MDKDQGQSLGIDDAAGNRRAPKSLAVACCFVLLSCGYFLTTRWVTTVLQSRGIATGSDDLAGILLLPLIASQAAGLLGAFFWRRKHPVLAQGLSIGVVILLSLLGGSKPSPLGDGFSKRAVARGTLGT